MLKTFTHGKQVCRYFPQLYGKGNMMQFNRYNGLIAQFKKHFGFARCHLASSPGRVEFVGNHTDHNGGKVVGCAINLDIACAFLPNDDGVVRLYGKNRRNIVFDVTQSSVVEGGSVGMVKGVVAYLANNGYNVGGFNAYCDSILPSGVGISSSAAFEMLVATIINHLYNDGKIPTEQMAKAGQYAENVYFGKPCGLLDQGVVATGGVVQLDFASGFCAKYLDANTNDLQLVLVDTGKSHSDLNHLYASIPADMATVAKHFGKDKLINVDADAFLQNKDKLISLYGSLPVLRAQHFFEENARVDGVCQALEKGDVNAVVQLVNESGFSSMTKLQNCAVDSNDTVIADAINFAHSVTHCGARVHGGGFAGTVLCVCNKERSTALVAQLKAQYGAQRIYPLRIRPVGATVLN